MKKFRIEAELIGTRIVTIEAKSLVQAKAKFADLEYHLHDCADEYHVDHVLSITELQTQ